MFKNVTKSLIICLLTMMGFGWVLTQSICAAPPVRVQAVKEANPMPEYPGGQEAFEKFINEHLSFPTDKQKRGDYVNAEITIRLIVMSDGTVGSHTVFKPTGRPYLNLKEIDKILKEMPKFSPGKVNGKPVNVQMLIPVTINPPAEE